MAQYISVSDQGAHSPSSGWRLFRRLGTGVAALRSWSARFRTAQFALDDLSEAEVKDLGLSRTSRRVRWLDGQDSSLNAHFEYRVAPTDNRIT